jgi:hypothetical protein
MWAVRLRIAYETAYVAAATSIDPFDPLVCGQSLVEVHDLLPCC